MTDTLGEFRDVVTYPAAIVAASEVMGDGLTFRVAQAMWGHAVGRNQWAPPLRIMIGVLWDLATTGARSAPTGVEAIRLLMLNPFDALGAWSDESVATAMDWAQSDSGVEPRWLVSMIRAAVMYLEREIDMDECHRMVREAAP